MSSSHSEIMHDITCPFCGLACDDVRVQVTDNQIVPTAVECMLSLTGFQHGSFKSDEVIPSAQIQGKPCALDTAIAKASTLLKNARMPVFSGLATDVAGARSALNLADKVGAVVDHMNSPGMFRNIRVMQDSGWMSSTLTDVRNHADLIVIVGAKLFELFPRFLERVVFPEKRMFSTKSDSQIVLVGPWEIARLPERLKQARPTIIPVEIHDLTAFAALLRARVSGRIVQNTQLSAVKVKAIDELSQKLNDAEYSTIVWAAGEQDYPHAELTVQNLTEVVKSLNRKTRSVVLPLGGSQGDMTFNQVCTWQTGYPVRTAFGSGQPHYDPLLHDHQRLLASGEADALLWLSCLTPDRPPPGLDIPTIVIGHPRMEFSRPPDVFLPAAIPGIDHSGHMYRSDAVTSLPLRKLRSPILPAASSLLDMIAAL